MMIFFNSKTMFKLKHTKTLLAETCNFFKNGSFSGSAFMNNGNANFEKTHHVKKLHSSLKELFFTSIQGNT